MKTSNAYLYILSRVDLRSMNPGKAVAQGAHAANQFMFHANKLRYEVARREGMITFGNANNQREEAFLAKLEEWERSTEHGFGTTITLGVTGEQLKTAVMVAKSLGFFAGVTHDPTYPIVDTVAGQPPVVHGIPLDTGGFVFGDKDDLRPILGRFRLMP